MTKNNLSVEKNVREEASPLITQGADFGEGNTRPGTVKSLLMVFFGVLFPLLCAGLIFGFAALKPILVKEGVYDYLCTEEKPAPCEAQKLKLDLMFTIGAAATNAFALPIGTILDKFGPRVTASIGSVVFGVGCFLFGIASNSLDLYIPGFVSLAIGGPFIFISLLHLCNLFPKYSGLIMGLSTGAFDASSSVFAVFAELYEVGISLKELFLGYMFIAGIVLIVSLFLMPDHQYGHAVEGGEGSANTTQTFCHNISHKGIGSQVLSTEFWLLVMFMSLYMLRLNFYIATVQEQIEEFAEEESAMMAKFFSILLPLGGALGVPLIGYYLDHRGIIESWYALGFMGIAFGVLSVIPQWKLQYVSMAIFAILRPFLYTAGSFYVGHMFGFGNFGKVYGFMVFITALVNTSQYGLDAMVKYTFDGSFFVVNVGLTVVGVLVLYFPYFLASKKNKIISQYSTIL
eukprot:Nk52_evm14s2496 gene=Nk52_evmTU14s2496